MFKLLIGFISLFYLCTGEDDDVPFQIHIMYGDIPSEMYIQFSSNSSVLQGDCLYGVQKNIMKHRVIADSKLFHQALNKVYIIYIYIICVRFKLSVL